MYYNNGPRNNTRKPRNANGDDNLGNLLEESSSGLGLEDKALLSSLIQDPKNRTPLDLIQVVACVTFLLKYNIIIIHFVMCFLLHYTGRFSFNTFCSLRS